ncbi:bifunctional 2-polyprenyl-6-hydroxyphenol methylase/3-demethylubiquinol 3-O-methyltransferase UbiG [Halioxenophilus sp. WMMB6]|uniref:bifunctional 2-polyprenyl-6-hydroxyphenol methylase/3-demethylubiquinol 3-O-methyltransferase UbiG n=1 Tax=Halioxenophilus sp. WMMB6 TaxID=3073815 RepID=UPI00295E8A3E|nr:bifunctional 2-polyprenyl-6-hydroxyphenol methylase/3-demethylubiquinol 3-O-methyltransferase UbiG [Halioxenophilus sp. WMMB6]
MTNADLSEIAKFDASAERWWDPNSEFKTLHDINPLRCNYIEAIQPVAELALLDVGCGGGILSEGLAQRGALVTGIDLAEQALSVARLHALESGVDITYLKSSVEALAEEHPSSFDVVTCMEMLEHVPEPDSVIAACAKLLKPGGNLFLSTINRNPKSYGAMIVAAEYLLKMVPKGTHNYQKFIRPAELAAMARSAGLLVRDITGLVYNPVFKSYKLTDKDVDVNYFMHVQKPDERA